MQNPPLQADRISFRYDAEEEPVIREFSFVFPESGMVGLLGPNGAGKSSLLALLSGAYKPDSGTVYIEGRESSLFKEEAELNDYITFVFQNMEFEIDEPIEKLMVMVGNINPEEKRASIKELARDFGIETILNKSIQKISKGELQKVILCFALLSRPRIFLLDEPVFALRREDSLTAMSIIKKYCHKHGLLVVFSIHELEYMEKFSDRIILFHKDGKYETGPANKCLSPEKLEAVYGVPYSMLKLPASTGAVFEELEEKQRRS